MINKVLGKTRFIKASHLIFLFVVLAILMFSSALIELHQSRKELIDLMIEQAHTLSETVLIQSKNNLKTNLLIEDIIEERLLNNASVIKSYYERGWVNNQFLEKFARENHIFRINIFNSVGDKVFSSHKNIHDDVPSSRAPENLLNPIFEGISDTLILGLKTARRGEGFRFAVAIAALDRSAILVNIDAAELLNFRREIGFGSILRKMILNSGILYTALQDTSGILAASGNVQELERIQSSDFLTSALEDSAFDFRITKFDTIRVFEAVHAFSFEDELIGLFRIGLSMEPLQAINSRIYRRIVVISIILFIIGFILITLLLIRQNLEISKKQYQIVETYSQNILQNVSDGIIVFNMVGNISLFNKSAERLCEVTADKIIGRNLKELFNPETCGDLVKSNFTMLEKDCTFNNQVKNLLISKSKYLNENDEWINILVIRDLTDRKRLETQIHRRERLSALGELASGVAHEIRNPLNAIGTIIQQLDRDFKPKQLDREYHQLTQLVYHEVRRINQTVEEFLRFARPAPLNPEEFQIEQLIDDIKKQYQSLLQEKAISFNIDMKWRGIVKWDREKMKQVLVNLIQNSLDVLGHNDSINLTITKTESSSVKIYFSDNGPGISSENLKKIFNLYFTTKTQGTGIGLSIVQRIVDQHEGVISVESQPGKGADFYIKLPVAIQNKKYSN